MRQYNVTKTDEEWQAELGEERFHILRNKGTERAGSGEYWNHFEKGTYFCAACGIELFSGEAKFDSSCGWPSFYEAVEKHRVDEIEDFSFGMERVEVVCANCGGHLGHVFEDAPKTPTGLRYCINSASLRFEPASGDEA
jgi:peptide-methionine (R)-S-oxide reductase